VSPPATSDAPTVPTVDLSGITKTYRMGAFDVPALRGVDMTVMPRDCVAIMGSSGSGKSTLLNLLGCLDRPTSGQYLLNGHDVSSLNDSDLSAMRNRFLGFVFQSYNLIEQLSVVENIEVPLFYQGLTRRQSRPVCEALADRVGLADRLDHRPSELSGGQQQRVAIARALANNPVLILADEPTGNLDSKTEGEVLDIFDELNHEGVTIIMVTHDQHVAERCQRIIWLKDGIVDVELAGRTPQPA
jgi:putative ABC transport system ATP-binding protein